MEIDIYELNWIPIKGYPGYEVATNGLICKKKKSGEREILVPYKDRQKKDGKNYVTIWKNFSPMKVWTIDIYKIAFSDILNKKEEKRDEKKEEDVTVGKVYANQKKKTRNPEELKKKFKEMVDGYNPDEMSASAYMKKLREQGYKFTSAHLGAELSKKKKKHENNSGGLF